MSPWRWPDRKVHHCGHSTSAYVCHPIYQLLSWNSFFWTWNQSWWEGKFRCSPSFSHTPRLQEAPLPLPLQMYFHLTSSQISGISLLGLSVLILWTDSIFEGVLPLRSCSFKDPQASTFLSERDRRSQNFSEEILFRLPYYSSMAFWLVHTHSVLPMPVLIGWIFSSISSLSFLLRETILYMNTRTLLALELK